MKIATWNVNSIRTRLPRLLDWLERNRPNVMCLQELKVTTEGFPLTELREAGYSAAVNGQKTYNGVAILSRSEPGDVSSGLGDPVEDPQARLLSARIDGVAVISAYFPNGGIVGSPGWVYKLEWMHRLRAHLKRRFLPSERVALCGDFNVAPRDADVCDPDAWRDTVLFHPQARAILARIADWGLVDAFQEKHPEGGIYSWWDYRRLAFPRNKGLRIDHIFLTRPLMNRCVSVEIDRQARKGKLPSDHAPVVAVLSD